MDIGKGKIMIGKQVLYVIPYPKFFSQHAGVGGHVAHAAGIVSGFVEHGFHVKVVVEENHDIFAQDDIDVDVLPAVSNSPLQRQLWALKLIRHIHQLVKHHRYGFCYIRYSASFAPWIPLLKRCLGAVPLFIEVNSLGSQWRKVLKPFDRMALSSADKVICISEVLRDFIKQLLKNKAEQVDIQLVINGVDVQRFDVTPKTLLPDDGTIHAGFAGLLKADYGIECIIDAAKLLTDKNIVLHIFGDGPYRQQLEEMAADTKNLYFHGPIAFLDMPAYLKALDILLYTTDVKHLYQSPTKIFEYMAAAKPIVSAITPQTQKLLKEEQMALFYDLGMASDMAEAIIRLSADQTLRASMGERSRIEALENHSWHARVTQIVS